MVTLKGFITRAKGKKVSTFEEWKSLERKRKVAEAREELKTKLAIKDMKRKTLQRRKAAKRLVSKLRKKIKF